MNDIPTVTLAAYVGIGALVVVACSLIYYTKLLNGTAPRLGLFTFTALTVGLIAVVYSLTGFLELAKESAVKVRAEASAVEVAKASAEEAEAAAKEAEASANEARKRAAAEAEAAREKAEESAKDAEARAAKELEESRQGTEDVSTLRMELSQLKERLAEVEKSTPGETGQAAEGALGLPAFPWNPPTPSSLAVIPRVLFQGAGKIGDITNKIVKVLDSEDYEHSFLSVPGGCAVITRIERINEDGASEKEPNRYIVNNLELQRAWSIMGFLRGLFMAPEGYFRVIVFVITDQPVEANGQPISSGESLGLLHSGAAYLPSSIADKEVSANMSVTALIYEFQSKGFEGSTKLVSPGHYSVHTHLEKARLSALVER